MKATFVLTPAEARRLIAKTVIQMPEFQKAWKEAYVLLAGGIGGNDGAHDRDVDGEEADINAQVD